METVNWHDKYMRDVEGLNNEGDPIGGDPACGMRHRIDALKKQIEEKDFEILERRESNVLLAEQNIELKDFRGRALKKLEACKRAAEVLREVADDIFTCHTIDGEWPENEDEAKAFHDEYKSLADLLAS